MVADPTRRRLFIEAAVLSRWQIPLSKGETRKLAAFLKHRDIRIESYERAKFLSSMLLSLMAILLVPLGLLSSEVRRGAGSDGIYALCERENITDTQTRECMIKMRLEEKRLAHR